MRKQTVQNVPKYRGQHHESNNLEGRMQFMIVKRTGADVTKKETNYFKGV